YLYVIPDESRVYPVGIGRCVWHPYPGIDNVLLVKAVGLLHMTGRGKLLRLLRVVGKPPKIGKVYFYPRVAALSHGLDDLFVVVDGYPPLLIETRPPHHPCRYVAR